MRNPCLRRMLLPLLVVTVFGGSACSYSAPSAFAFMLPSGSIELEQLDHGPSWDGAPVAPPAPQGVSAQWETLQGLKAAVISGKGPAPQGVRYRLKEAARTDGAALLVLGIRTRSPGLFCELDCSGDGSRVLAGFAWPPSWSIDGADWELMVRLPAGTSIHGFRVSSLFEASAVDVVSARLGSDSPSLAWGAGERRLELGFMRLSSGTGIRWDWGDNEALRTPQTKKLSLRYRAAAPGSVRASLAMAGTSAAFELRLRPGEHQISWYALDPALSALSLDKAPQGFELLELSCTPDVPQAETAEGRPELPLPRPGDLSALLDYPQAAWRQPDFEVFSWNLFPDILMIDFASLEVQNRYFKRLIFFTEKKGFRGSLQTNAVLAPKHGWNANDFRAESLAAFFSLARAKDFGLNPEEERLLELCLAWGLIRAEGDGFAPVRGGLVSVARDTKPDARLLLLQHECIHGIYFSSAEFRKACEQEFAGLSPGTRRFLLDYFSFYQYDPADPYLMTNEMAAYLLQQSVPGVSYLVGVTMVNNWVKVYPAEKASFEARAKAAVPELERVASRLGKALLALHGIEAARLSCVISR